VGQTAVPQREVLCRPPRLDRAGAGHGGRAPVVRLAAPDGRPVRHGLGPASAGGTGAPGLSRRGGVPGRRGLGADMARPAGGTLSPIPGPPAGPGQRQCGKDPGGRVAASDRHDALVAAVRVRRSR
jgi:hypothetical protein